MAEIESLLIRLEADAALMRRELARANNSVDQFANKAGRGMSRFQRSMQRAQRQASRFAVGVAGAMATAFGARAVRDAVAYGAALEHTSRRLGFTAEQIQEVRFAASDFGIEARQVDMALQRFTRRLSQAAQEGRGELLPVLEAMGVQFRNNDGTTRDSMAVLLDFADAMQSMENQGDRLLAGFKAFDSEGAVMINVLQQGREGMAAYAQQARDLGIILTNEMARDAAVVDRQLDLLGQRFRGQFTSAVLESSEGLEEFVVAAGSAISAIVRLIGWVSNLASTFGTTLGDALTDAQEQMADLEIRTPQEKLDFAEDFIADIEAGTVGVIEARRRLENELGVLGTVIAERAGLPEQRRQSGGATASIIGVTRSDIDPGETLEPTSEAVASIRDALREMGGEWERINAAASDPAPVQTAEELAAAEEKVAEAARQAAQEQARLNEMMQAPLVRAMETQRAMAESLRQQIAVVNEERSARESLEDQLAAEAVVRQLLAQINEGGANEEIVEQVRQEALEVARLTRVYGELEEARAQAEAAAMAVVEGAMTGLDQFERDVQQLKDLLDSGALADAAAEMGLDVDTVKLRAVRGLLEDLHESGGLAAMSAEELRAALASLDIPDGVLDKLREMPEKIIEAKEAAQRLTEEFAEGVGKSIEDAITNARSLKDLLGDIARQIARMLIRQNIVNPVVGFISRSLGNVLGGGGSDGGGQGFSLGQALGSSLAGTMSGAAGLAGKSMGQAIQINLDTTLNANGADAQALEQLQGQLAAFQQQAPEMIVSGLRERDRRGAGVNI